MTWREPGTGEPKTRALLTPSGRGGPLQVVFKTKCVCLRYCFVLFCPEPKKKGQIIGRDKMGRDRIKFVNLFFFFYYFVNGLALRLYTTHFSEFDPIKPEGASRGEEAGWSGSASFSNSKLGTCRSAPPSNFQAPGE